MELKLKLAWNFCPSKKNLCIFYFFDKKSKISETKSQRGGPKVYKIPSDLNFGLKLISGLNFWLKLSSDFNFGLNSTLAFKF